MAAGSGDGPRCTCWRRSPAARRASTPSAPSRPPCMPRHAPARVDASMPRCSTPWCLRAGRPSLRQDRRAHQRRLRLSATDVAAAQARHDTRCPGLLPDPHRPAMEGLHHRPALREHHAAPGPRHRALRDGFRRARPADHGRWQGLPTKADLPCFATRDFAALVADPHLVDIACFSEVEHLLHEAADARIGPRQPASTIEPADALLAARLECRSAAPVVRSERIAHDIAGVIHLAGRFWYRGDRSCHRDGDTRRADPPSARRRRGARKSAHRRRMTATEGKPEPDQTVAATGSPWAASHRERTRAHASRRIRSRQARPTQPCPWNGPASGAVKCARTSPCAFPFRERLRSELRRSTRPVRLLACRR